jgi:hypothetical protein
VRISGIQLQLYVNLDLVDLFLRRIYNWYLGSSPGFPALSLFSLEVPSALQAGEQIKNGAES